MKVEIDVVESESWAWGVFYLYYWSITNEQWSSFLIEYANVLWNVQRLGHVLARTGLGSWIHGWASSWWKWFRILNHKIIWNVEKYGEILWFSVMLDRDFFDLRLTSFLLVHLDHVSRSKSRRWLCIAWSFVTLWSKLILPVSHDAN